MAAAAILDDVIPARVGGNVGMAHLLEHLDAAAPAGTFDQPHQRQPHLIRKLLAVNLLAGDRGVRGAAPDGEVITAYHDLAAVDAASSGNKVGRREVRQLAIAVISGRSR
jgi:hypothetical protein